MDQDKKPKQAIDTGGGTYINGDVHVNGNFTGRDSINGAFPFDPNGPGADDARACYLSLLRKQYNFVETHAFTDLAEDEQVGKPRRLPLLGKDGIYVPLYLDAPLVRQESPIEQMPESLRRKWDRFEWESKPKTLPDILKIFKGRHLAIIGDAGSGKTTLLHVLVSALAAEDPSTLDPELAAALPAPRPLPILLPLRFFEQACCDRETNHSYTHCTADLLRFTDDWFRQWCSEADRLPPRYLEGCIRAGKAWFLLDALDEVADSSHRASVRNIIHALAEQFPDTRLIVTARVAAYHHARLNDDFTVMTVRDLDEAQRTQMVHTIYQGLALPDAAGRAEDLDRRFRESESLRELSRTPVMVWTAAVIHALRGELPEGRAALYDAYVTILLKQSFKRTRYDVTSVDRLTDDEAWSLADRRHYLTYTAFRVHKLLESQPGRQGKRRALVGEDELVDEILAPYLQEHLMLPRRQARERARDFVALMVERSGLLYETEQGYTIGDHLTMQEFLAAWYLAENYAGDEPEAYTAFVREKVGESWWREVFILAAGYLAGKPGFQGSRFIQRIAAQGEPPVAHLAALTLAGESLLQLHTLQRQPTWYPGLAQQLGNQLYDQLYAQECGAPVVTRQTAGLVLGRLYRMPGAGGLTDPRFSEPLGLLDFVKIPAGTFWMGEDQSPRENEQPRHQVTLDAYEIAKYPTTNAMFSCFIAAGGYAQARWWKEAIAGGYWDKAQGFKYGNLPRYWTESQFNTSAQPVVGISWYESVAYCRWLTEARDDGCTYRLPTEAEWERAARGLRGARYPWGETWEDGCCNSQESNLGRTSPVGIFPKGAAEGSIHDMVGNVWEWTSSLYKDYPYRVDDGREYLESAGPRVLRGGSFDLDRDHARCAYRGRYNPRRFNVDFGFRVVCSPSASAL